MHPAMVARRPATKRPSGLHYAQPRKLSRFSVELQGGMTSWRWHPPLLGAVIMSLVFQPSANIARLKESATLAVAAKWPRCRIVGRVVIGVMATRLSQVGPADVRRPRIGGDPQRLIVIHRPPSYEVAEPGRGRMRSVNRTP